MAAPARQLELPTSDAIAIDITTSPAAPLTAASDCQSITLSENVHATILLERVHPSVALTPIERQITLARGASLNLLVCDTPDIHTYSAESHIALATNSHCSWLDLKTGSGNVSEQLNVNLNAENAEFSLNALALGGESAGLTTRCHVTHKAPNTHSEQTQFGIATGRSHIAFDSAVHITAKGQGAEAHQTAKHLSLSPLAKIDCKPTLEIDTDDVVCSHGATLGQLDENALFYMQSRGLSENEARAQLLRTYAATFISALPHDLNIDAVISRVDHALTALDGGTQ